MWLSSRDGSDDCADACGQTREAASRAVRGAVWERVWQARVRRAQHVLIVCSNEGSVISGMECGHWISLGQSAVFNTFVLRHKTHCLQLRFPQTLCECVSVWVCERASVPVATRSQNQRRGSSLCCWPQATCWPENFTSFLPIVTQSCARSDLRTAISQAMYLFKK